MRMPYNLRSQRGATLIVGLVMLTLLTLLAMSALSSSMLQMRVIGNAQAQQESIAAANSALQKTLSTPAFMLDSATVTATPVLIDVNQDGVADYTVTILPTCTGSIPFLNAQLDVNNADDFKCFVSQELFDGKSLCAQTSWELEARASDVNQGGARATIYEGVTIRAALEDVKNSC